MLKLIIKFLKTMFGEQINSAVWLIKLYAYIGLFLISSLIAIIIIGLYNMVF